ncbi:hypothetical protein A2U01_0053248, partial [Trifolium medium]|nr:hypothetical protein [Trifolium medium]
TKGAPKGWPKGSSKRPSYSQDERSTKHSPSLVEHAESQYPDTPVSQLLDARRKSSQKCSQSPHPTPVATPKRTWPNMEQLPLFMHPFIENVIDIAEDEHCGFGV